MCRRVLSRSVIIEHLWKTESSPDEHAVKVHIRSLRQKLKATGAGDDFIETIHGIGYRLAVTETQQDKSLDSLSRNS